MSEAGVAGGSPLTRIFALIAAIAAVCGALGGIYMLNEQTTLMRAQSVEMGRLIEQATAQNALLGELKTAQAAQSAALQDLEERSERRRLFMILNDRIPAAGCEPDRPSGARPPCPFAAGESSRRAAVESLVGLDADRRKRLGEGAEAWKQFDAVEIIGAALPGANLEGARFDNANLREVDLSGAKLDKATFYSANLRGANLTGASIEGAAFEGVIYDKNTRWPEGFDPTSKNMRHIGHEVDLEKTDLRGADLTGSILTGANLEAADLRWARIEGAICDEKTLLPKKTHACTRDGLVIEREKQR